MRKVVLLLTGLIILGSSFATTNVIKPKLNASEIFFPVGNTGKKISLLELSQIKAKDLQALTGRKMDAIDKASFSLAQKKVRNMINRDGTIDSKKLQKYMKGKAGETGFHLGGFALGFFLGPIGVLIAYLLNDDYKSNRVKWSWIGFGAALLINIILVVVLLDAFSDEIE